MLAVAQRPTYPARREIAQAPWATPSPLHAADPPLPGLDGLRARPAFRRLRNGSAARTVQAGSAAAGHFSRLAARAGHAAGRSSRGLPAQHPQDRRRPSVRGQAGRGVERVCARRGHERRARRLSGPFRGVLTRLPSHNASRINELLPHSCRISCQASFRYSACVAADWLVGPPLGLIAERVSRHFRTVATSCSTAGSDAVVADSSSDRLRCFSGEAITGVSIRSAPSRECFAPAVCRR